MKQSASSGPRSDPIGTPSFCQYNRLLNLNWTLNVHLSNNSVIYCVGIPRPMWLISIWLHKNIIVLFRGTFVNSEATSKESKNLPMVFMFLINSINSKYQVYKNLVTRIRNSLVIKHQDACKWKAETLAISHSYGLLNHLGEYYSDFWSSDLGTKHSTCSSHVSYLWKAIIKLQWGVPPVVENVNPVVGSLRQLCGHTRTVINIQYFSLHSADLFNPVYPIIIDVSYYFVCHQTFIQFCTRYS